MFARKLDPELEKLRQEGVEASCLETVVFNVQQIASQIHASYLFEIEGKQLLQKLCLFLSATPSGKSYGDWQTFATHLGLTNQQIKCIDYDFKGLQDPTYYVLLAFAQSVEATMDKIFLGLQKMNRKDIISIATDCFNEFFQTIIQNKSSNLKNGKYRPNLIPRAPLVLSPFVKNQNNISHDLTKDAYNFHKQYVMTQNVNQKYGSIVMLTFAEDGRNSAEEITRIFRSRNPKIGVIILQEQEKHVYCRAEEFIDDCFKQVNYIVPILTEDYLFKINGFVDGQNDNNTLDSKYIRYIYSLLRYEYVKQDCVNNRVRCIIPDAQVKKVLAMDLHPTLQAWFRESDVQRFAERILLQKF